MDTDGDLNAWGRGDGDGIMPGVVMRTREKSQKHQLCNAAEVITLTTDV